MWILFLIFINPSSDENLSDKVVRILKKNLPKNSEYSITCFSTTRKDFVLKINSSKPLIPASTNKLFTTGVALLNLGNEFTIDTEIYTDDFNLNDGVINGNIYLKGNGDPSLTTTDLLELVRKLKNLGISGITGNIIVDDTFFEETFYRNEWIEDENVSVPLPPISSLTLNDNSILIHITGSSKLNSPGQITFHEQSGYFRILNKTKTSRRTTKLHASSTFVDGKEIITVSGLIRKNRSVIVKAYVANPPIYAGNLFMNKLRENGISFWGEIKKGHVPKLSNKLIENKKPLVELIKPINKNSNNFYAEHLFLIIGGEYSKGNGSPFDANQAIITFLKSLNIYETEFNMVDGSGISRRNQFSTETLVKFLYQIYLNPIIFNDFYNSLSIPQTDGTLSNRLSKLSPPERVRGKTGTLNGVTSLAGYVKSKSGDLLIFSINFNYKKGSQYKMRMVQDEIMTLIADNL